MCGSAIGLGGILGGFFSVCVYWALKAFEPLLLLSLCVIMLVYIRRLVWLHCWHAPRPKLHSMHLVIVRVFVLILLQIFWLPLCHWGGV